MGDHSKVATFDRMKQKVMRNEAISQAKTELMADSHASIEDRFAPMEKEDELDRILNELKANQRDRRPANSSYLVSMRAFHCLTVHSLIPPSPPPAHLH